MNLAATYCRRGKGKDKRKEKADRGEDGNWPQKGWVHWVESAPEMWLPPDITGSLHACVKSLKKKNY